MTTAFVLAIAVSALSLITSVFMLFRTISARRRAEREAARLLASSVSLEEQVNRALATFERSKNSAERHQRDSSGLFVVWAEKAPFVTWHDHMLDLYVADKDNLLPEQKEVEDWRVLIEPEISAPKARRSREPISHSKPLRMSHGAFAVA